MEDQSKMLDILGISENKKKQFKRKNIIDIPSLLEYFPRKYMDYRYETPIQEGQICIHMHVSQVKSGVSKKGRFYIITEGMGFSKYLSETGKEISDFKPVSVMWFECRYKEKEIRTTAGKDVIVAGKMKYDPEWNKYSIGSPDLFTTDVYQAKKIYPIYPKIAGMSDEYLLSCIHSALNRYPEMIHSDLPSEIKEYFSLMERKDAVRTLHCPDSMEQLEAARLRILCDDLYTFALHMYLEDSSKKDTAYFKAFRRELFHNIISQLPYHLTVDQEKAVYEIADRMKTGKRVHALVQGDVGCGKTIVSILATALVVDNGYQIVLLAPTAVLESQHYLDLCRLISSYNIGVEYIPSLTSLKKSEREAFLTRISSGKTKVLVGTHSLLNDSIKFDKLGMIIADEEHKFGVEQREHLLNRFTEGIHYITMSATPIPRSLAGVIYGRSQLYLIQSMPAGRVPVRTTVYHNWKGCFRFMQMQIDAGRQIYIVCPQVDINEKRPDIMSVNELTKIYGNVFEQEKIRTLTGRNTKKEVKKILEEFRSGTVPILIATTVIEVGVNVPNANTIIIHNAENFGLASLHQLRGRVGRGGGEAYCILFSEDTDNERLKVMEQTNNGFEIAEADLKLRGAGDLIGDQQSGREFYTSLAIQNADLYHEIRRILNTIMSN